MQRKEDSTLYTDKRVLLASMLVLRIVILSEVIIIRKYMYSVKIYRALSHACL